MHSGKRDHAPEVIRGSQGSGRDRPASEGPNKKTRTQKNSTKRHQQPECDQHSGKGDRPPELIRGSQGSGRDRPASEGPNKKTRTQKYYLTGHRHEYLASRQPIFQYTNQHFPPFKPRRIILFAVQFAQRRAILFLRRHGKNYPFETPLPGGLKVSGVVLSDHIKSLDWRARKATFAGKAPENVVADVRAKIQTLL